MRRCLASFALVMVPCSFMGATATAQQAAARTEPRAQVMMLGVYHFENPGLDVVKTDVADVLTPARQAEITQLVDALARFRPTKIAVEVRADRAARVDSLYAAYRARRDTLTRSEVQQLGFRLADRFGHDRLYSIDHAGAFPFGAVMQYAQAHDPAFVQRVGQVTAAMAAEMNRNQQRMSVGQLLRFENDPARIQQGHAMYIEMAKVGAGDTFVGADLLAKWYERNIRIFSEVQRISQPGDRILVIFGAGHAAILRELIAGDARFDLIEPNQYLPGGG